MSGDTGNVLVVENVKVIEGIVRPDYCESKFVPNDQEEVAQSLANDITAVVDRYRDRGIMFSTIIGILEIVKSDVISEM